MPPSFIRLASEREIARRGWAALVALTALAGCAGAPSPAVESAGTASAERCTIGGTADALVVAVPGVTAPAVRASSVRAELEFPLEPETTSVAAHVLGPIEFRGEARLEAVHLVANVPIVRGPLTVYAGAPLGRASVGRGDLRAFLALGGDPSTPEVAVYLEVSCAEVALGEEGEPPPDVSDPALPTHVLVGTQDLSVSLSPGGPAALTFAVADGASQPLQLEVVEQREGWVHVRSRLYWAELDGWIAATRVRAEPQERWRMTGAFSYGGLGACGRSDHPYSYRGPAIVRARTTVHDEVSRVVWGRFTVDTEVEIGVRLHDDNGFAEVIRVAGIDMPECSSLEFDHAMVPLEGVVLP